MNKKVLVVACLMMMTTMVFTGCDLLGGDKNKEGTKVEQNKESSSNGDGNYFETMTKLMERGKSMKCTYTQEVDGDTASGVVYMADGNALVEITIKTENNPTGKMYALMNKEYQYSWVDGSSKGYKMTTEAAELSEKQEESVSNMSKDINFECKKWKKDSSKFKVPSNINFEDMSEMMEGMGDVNFEEMTKETTAQAEKFICDLCKNAPVSEQAECLGGVVCDWSE